MREHPIYSSTTNLFSSSQHDILIGSIFSYNNHTCDDAALAIKIDDKIKSLLQFHFSYEKKKESKVCYDSATHTFLFQFIVPYNECVYLM